MLVGQGQETEEESLGDLKNGYVNNYKDEADDEMNKEYEMYPNGEVMDGDSDEKEMNGKEIENKILVVYDFENEGEMAGENELDWNNDGTLNDILEDYWRSNRR